MSNVKRAVSALSEQSSLRYISFGGLYVAQGLPEGLLFYAIPAWLAINGKSPAEIGAFVGIVLLPWSFKLFNAPIMDRFTFLPMGRRRPWVLIGQLGLLLSFFSISLVSNPLDNLALLTGTGFMVSFFGAFQDVAVDGMAIDVLPLDQQARANGVMWGSKTMGTSLSVALGSWLINAYGLSSAVLVFSLLIGLIMFLPLSVRERPGERLLPWTSGDVSEEAAALQLHDWRTIFKSVRQAFFLPVSLLMGMAVFSTSIGRGLIDTVLPVLTVQQLGWADSDYSRVFAIANLASGALGMFIGGALVDFFGKVRMMSFFLFGLIGAVICMSLLEPWWSNGAVVVGFMVAFYSLVVFYTIAVFATAMQLCWPKVAATQFTLYMVVSNLGLSVGAALIGPLTKAFTWPQIVLAYAFFAAFSLVVLRFVCLDKHRVGLSSLDPEAEPVLDMSRAIPVHDA